MASFEPFLEIWIYQDGGYIKKDISDRLIPKIEIEEQARDSNTGGPSVSGFTLTVDNSDGFWLDIGTEAGISKQIGNGDDLYSKGLLNRRVSVGRKRFTGNVYEKEYWATGTIKEMVTDTDSKNCILTCESLENEAKELRLDVDSGMDAVGQDYGIRGHVIEHDGSIRDDPFAIYKDKTTYVDEDKSTDYEFFNGVRVKTALDHIQNCMDISQEGSDFVEDAYKRGFEEVNFEYIQKATADQFSIQYAATLDLVSESIAITIPDDSGVFVYLHDDGAGSTYLTLFNYRTNTWKQWYDTVSGEFKPYKLVWDAVRAVSADLSFSSKEYAWYNSDPGSNRWFFIEDPFTSSYPPGLVLWEYDEATDDGNVTGGIGFSSVILETVMTLPAALGGGPWQAGNLITSLCFAQTTQLNGGVGSLFVIGRYTPIGPGVNQWVIYEMSIQTIAAIAQLLAVQDPIVTGALPPPAVGAGYVIWGWGMAPAANRPLCICNPQATYDTVGIPPIDGLGNPLPFPGAYSEDGLMFMVSRTNLAGQFSDCLVWVDIYQMLGGAGVPGIGVSNWEGVYANPIQTRYSSFGGIFRVYTPTGFYVTVVCLGDPNNPLFDSKAFFRLEDRVDWGIIQDWAALVAGAQFLSYFGQLTVDGIISPSEWQPDKIARFYFLMDAFTTFGLSDGELRSTDGDTLSIENKDSSDSVGESVFGPIKVGSGLTRTSLKVTRDTAGLALITGAFNQVTSETFNWCWVFGWNIYATLPIFDVSDLSIYDFLSLISQWLGYDVHFGGRGELHFKWRGVPDVAEDKYLERYTKIGIESMGWDEGGLVNQLKITPYTVTDYKVDKEGGPAYLVTPFETTNSNAGLRYLRVNFTSSIHEKVAAVVSDAGWPNVFISRWDTTLGYWVDITGGGSGPSGEWVFTVAGDGDWQDATEKYKILVTDWFNTGSINAQDHWMFWTYKTAQRLISMEDQYMFETNNLDSIKKHGVKPLEITDNRFITQNDIRNIANRILYLRKNPKRRLIVETDLDIEIPEVGDIIRFENEALRITSDDRWRIIGRLRSLASTESPEGKVKLRIEEAK